MKMSIETITTNIISSVMGGLIIAGIIGGIGTLIVGKINNNNINYLKEEITQLKNDNKQSQNSLDTMNQNGLHIQYIRKDINKLSYEADKINTILESIKAIVSSKHPEESKNLFASAEKLNRMNADERGIITQATGEYKTADAFYHGVATDANVSEVITRYLIDQNDLKNIWQLKNRLNINDSNEPNKFQRQIMPLMK
ncbi:MAG: hypothetical protein JXA96_11265 [Sedimentisphaerales bacterium]|nr:hypothetical protein [Sedimentisphaerales bacterium]